MAISLTRVRYFRDVHTISVQSQQTFFSLVKLYIVFLINTICIFSTTNTIILHLCLNRPLLFTILKNVPPNPINQMLFYVL